MSSGDDAAVVLDDVDRALLIALDASGRDSWSLVAGTIGCSPSTAQRRYARLCEAGVLRVIAAVDVLASGMGVSVLLRVRCGAAAAPTVAATLATRSEVRFVSTITGSADCVAEIVLDQFADLEPLLDGLFPDPEWRTEALPVMKTFTVPFRSLATAVLSDVDIDSSSQQSEAAQPALPLSAAERTLISYLIEDGRTPLVDLARAISRSEQTTRRMVEALVDAGRIRIGPLIDPRLLSRDAEIMVWLSVAPEHLGAAARQLASHPAVHYTSATAGRYNLVGQAFLGTFADTYDFTTAVVGALPGIREVDVTVQMTTHKRMWSVLNKGRFTSTKAAESAGAAS